MKFGRPDDKRTRIGDAAERVFEAVFQAAGFFWVPLSRIEDGGAPMAKAGGGNGLISPDGLASNHLVRVFAEVKGKSHAVSYRMADHEKRHGIDKINLEHYVSFAAMHRLHCCICILEYWDDEANTRWSGALLVQTLAKLGRPISGHGTQPHMIYWPRTRFAILGHVTQRQLLGGSAPCFTERLNEILGVGTTAPVQGGLF